MTPKFITVKANNILSSCLVAAHPNEIKLYGFSEMTLTPDNARLLAQELHHAATQAEENKS